MQNRSIITSIVLSVLLIFSGMPMAQAQEPVDPQVSSPYQAYGWVANTISDPSATTRVHKWSYDPATGQYAVTELDVLVGAFVHSQSRPCGFLNGRTCVSFLDSRLINMVTHVGGPAREPYVRPEAIRVSGTVGINVTQFGIDGINISTGGPGAGIYANQQAKGCNIARVDRHNAAYVEDKRDHEFCMVSTPYAIWVGAIYADIVDHYATIDGSVMWFGTNQHFVHQTKRTL